VTYGHQIEAIARRPLWAVGRDFKHGVGHGVSHCGPVHEYPHYAYAKPRPGAPLIPLQPHMCITNEPGYYEQGQFGIRIENILKVQEMKISRG
jgi:Xaa-Pro aminopeptidase